MTPLGFTLTSESGCDPGDATILAFLRACVQPGASVLFLVCSKNESGAAECVSHRGYWRLVQSDMIKLPDSASQTALGAASGL